MELLPERCRKIVSSDEFADKIYLFKRYWNADDCEQDSRSLFVFGDNDIKKGCGGQAVIRYCPNAIGLPTKKYPNNSANSFYTDDEYQQNCAKIVAAMVKIIDQSISYECIIFPSDGFGTGLARLPEKAPLTHKFLEDLMKLYFGVDYEMIRKEDRKKKSQKINK